MLLFLELMLTWQEFDTCTHEDTDMGPSQTHRLTRAHTQTHTHTRTPARTRTCTHTHMPAGTRAHTHTHTCAHPLQTSFHLGTRCVLGQPTESTSSPTPICAECQRRTNHHECGPCFKGGRTPLRAASYAKRQHAENPEYRHSVVLLPAAGLSQAALVALTRQNRAVTGRVLAMLYMFSLLLPKSSDPVARAVLVEGGAVELTGAYLTEAGLDIPEYALEFYLTCLTIPQAREKLCAPATVDQLIKWFAKWLLKVCGLIVSQFQAQRSH
jgi:hypothetical protein